MMKTQTCEECDCADPTALYGLAAECDCRCHKPEPRIVAECWTCPRAGDGWPGTLFFRERLASDYPDTDSRSIAYHCAAGHDVREVRR